MRLASLASLASRVNLADLTSLAGSVCLAGVVSMEDLASNRFNGITWGVPYGGSSR